MPRLPLLIVFLCCLPLAACLHCYVCLFPAISPLDCLRFPPGVSGRSALPVKHCNRKTGRSTSDNVREELCRSAQCGLSGQKYASGLFFNYTNICCDTDLCNGAVSVAALSWGGAALCLLPGLALLLA